MERINPGTLIIKAVRIMIKDERTKKNKTQHSPRFETINSLCFIYRSSYMRLLLIKFTLYLAVCCRKQERTHFWKALYLQYKFLVEHKLNVPFRISNGNRTGTDKLSRIRIYSSGIRTWAVGGVKVRLQAGLHHSVTDAPCSMKTLNSIT